MNCNEILEKFRKKEINCNEILLDFINKIFRNTGEVFKSIYPKESNSTALNSLSGKITDINNKEYFFKFHTEENENLTQSNDMYNSSILHSNGWNVLKPKFCSTKVGEQCVIYEWNDSPTLYQLLLEQEKHYGQFGKYTDDKSNLISSISNSLQNINSCLFNTLELNTDSSNSPIHQLFGVRLKNCNKVTSRATKFYGEFLKSNQANIAFKIKGEKFYPIKYYFELMQKYLDAKNFKNVSSVIAHGDEHFANQMLLNDQVVLFDPAFASRMPLILSQIKAVTHNVLCHPYWYYESAQVEDLFDLPKSIIREEILDLYKQKIWNNIISQLKSEKVSEEYLFNTIFSAVLASPLLAKNLSIQCLNNTPKTIDYFKYSIYRSKRIVEFLIDTK
jgi:hypothetical protein